MKTLPIERAEMLGPNGRVTGHVYRFYSDSEEDEPGHLKSVIVSNDGHLELHPGSTDAGVLRLRKEVPALVATLKSWLACHEEYLSIDTYRRGPCGMGRGYAVCLPGSARPKEITEEQTVAYAVTIRPEREARESFPRLLAVASTEDGHVAMRLLAVADWLHAVLRRDEVRLGQYTGDTKDIFFGWPWRRTVGKVRIPKSTSGKKFSEGLSLTPEDASLIVLAVADTGREEAVRKRAGLQRSPASRRERMKCR
jgi:hypothetical protein